MLPAIVLAVTWISYAPFMSPITASVKANLVANATAGVVGRMGQIGDSITNAPGSFQAAMQNGGPEANDTGHDLSPIIAWIGPTFYLTEGKGASYGNQSGWTLADAMTAGHPNTDHDFSWVLIQLGTNDIDDPAHVATTWGDSLETFAQGYLTLGILPVLCTIPQRNFQADKIAALNAQVVEAAAALEIPMVDLFRLFKENGRGMRGPDGTHLSGNGLLFTKQGLTATDGNAARTFLAFQMAERLKAIVFDGGAAEPMRCHVGGSF